MAEIAAGCTLLWHSLSSDWAAGSGARGTDEVVGGLSEFSCQRKWDCPLSAAPPTTSSRPSGKLQSPAFQEARHLSGCIGLKGQAGMPVLLVFHGTAVLPPPSPSTVTGTSVPNWGHTLLPAILLTFLGANTRLWVLPRRAVRHPPRIEGMRRPKTSNSHAASETIAMPWGLLLRSYV